MDVGERVGMREGKQFRRGSLHFHFQSLKQSLSTLNSLYKRNLPINPHIQTLLYFLPKYFWNGLTERWQELLIQKMKSESGAIQRYNKM
jgi:hypothetical protein